jgi:diguanylate cyclase (GGDEF)-like protein
LTVDLGSSPIAGISRFLPLTPALLARTRRPLPLAGTTFAVANREGRILVRTGRGEQLPASGEVTLGSVRYGPFSTRLLQSPYRLVALAPEQHFQPIFTQQTKLLVIVGLTLFVSLALALLLGATMIASLGDVFRRAEHARTDELTSLGSRRAFREALTREIQRSHRHGSPLTLALFDVDRFKQVNDRCGHPAGDRVLVASARAVERNLRETDVLALVGGEEFAVMLPNTDPNGAAELTERLRAALQPISPPSTDVDTQISASFGVVELDKTSDDDAGEALIAAADSALYNAKSLGRNRVFAERLSEVNQVT